MTSRLTACGTDATDDDDDEAHPTALSAHRGTAVTTLPTAHKGKPRGSPWHVLRNITIQKWNGKKILFFVVPLLRYLNSSVQPDSSNLLVSMACILGKGKRVRKMPLR
jgi:hypothetical protein